MDDHRSSHRGPQGPPEPPLGPCGSVVRSELAPDVLVMTGEVDVSVAQGALADPSAWEGVRTVDARGLTFLDSAGMRLVVRVARLARPHRLRVVGAAGQPLDTLHHFGAEQVLELS